MNGAVGLVGLLFAVGIPPVSNKRERMEAHGIKTYNMK